MNISQNNLQLFVLLFEGRTGSSYIISALNQHPEIKAEGEELAFINTSASQINWIKDLFNSTPRKGAVGFKTKLRVVIDKESFSETLVSYNAKIIFLGRRNIIKSVVSDINANRLKKAFGDYNIRKDKHRLPPPKIYPDMFNDWLLNRERLDAELNSFVKSLNLPTLKIFYEDLLMDESGLFTKILSFLGLEHVEMKGNFLKVTSDDLRYAVKNFDELRSYYIGTPYEPMFDEVLIDAPPEAFSVPFINRFSTIETRGIPIPNSAVRILKKLGIKIIKW
jgi:hypothetical protein